MIRIVVFALSQGSSHYIALLVGLNLVLKEAEYAKWDNLSNLGIILQEGPQLQRR
jgi:hypothetical protein